LDPIRERERDERIREKEREGAGEGGGIWPSRPVGAGVARSPATAWPAEAPRVEKDVE